MKYFLCFFIGLISSLSIFAQSDSTFYVFQQELKELRTQRIQDSLKMDILTQELQYLLYKETEHTNENFEKIKAEEDSLRIQQQLHQINSIKARTQGAPVIVDLDTIFRIYANLGPYNSLERARTANNKINSVIKRTFYNPDSLKIKNTFNITTITYNNEVIVAIDELDALWANKNIDELAKQQHQLLNDHILQYRKAHSVSSKLKSIGELLLILGAFAFMIFVVIKLFRRLKLFLLNGTKWFKSGIHFKNYELIKRSQLNYFLDKTFILLKFLIIAVLFFISLPFALKLFPQTSRYAEELKDLIFDPIQSLVNSLINYLPNLVKIVLILVLIRFVLKIMRYFSNEIENEKLKISTFYPEWAKPTYSIVRFLLSIFALIIIFPYLPGSGTIAFQGVTVFLGILISIGSSSAISNAIAGIVITYMRPFQKGDWIKTGDTTGIVIEKNALVTRLKTINNEDVTVPNSSVLSGATINFSSLGRTYGLSITARIDVKYTEDEAIVTEHLLKAAVQTTGISDRRKPYVFQISLNEINATYEINAITYEPKNMYFIKSDLVRNVHKVFKEAGIPLSSVQFVSLEETKKEL